MEEWTEQARPVQLSNTPPFGPILSSLDWSRAIMRWFLTLNSSLSSKPRRLAAKSLKSTIGAPDRKFVRVCEKAIRQSYRVLNAVCILGLKSDCPRF